MNKKVIYFIIILGFLFIGIGSVKLFSLNDETNNIENDDNQGNNVNDNGDIDNEESTVISAKKVAYVNVISSYIDGARMKVNMGFDYRFYDTEVLYLIPVGNDKCIEDEVGTGSPFGERWEYAYVGVTYDGNIYNYFAVAKDSSGMGINYVSSSSLDSLGKSLVVDKNSLATLDLATVYSSSNVEKYAYVADSEYLSVDEVSGLRDVLELSSRDRVIIVSNCEY